MASRRLETEMAAGILMAATGVAALWFLRNLSVGSASQMGPGYMPNVVAGLLAVVGLLQTLAAVRGARSVPLEGWAWRETILVIASIAAFALLVPQFGLVPATTASVVLAVAANRHARWIEAGALTLGLVAFCVVLFVQLLRLPIPLWPA